MSAPLGRAFIEVLADLKKFPGDLKKKLQGSLDDVGKTVDFDEFEKSGGQAGERTAEKFEDEFVKETKTKGKQKLKRAAENSGKDVGEGFLTKLRSVVISKGGLYAALGLAGAGVGGALQNALPALLASIPALAIGAAGAIGTLVLSLHGFFAAIGAGVSGDTAAFNEALKKLTPAAQSVAREIVGLTGAFKGLQQQVQQSFFAQLEGSVTRLARNLLPVLRAQLPGIAADLGKLGASFLGGIGNGSSAIGTILANLDAGLRPFIPLVGQLVTSLLKVGAIAAPVIAQIASGLAGHLGDFITNLNTSLGNGGVLKFFDTAGEFFSSLGGAIGPILGLVEDLLSALSGVGSPTLALLGDVANTLRTSIGPLLGPLSRFLDVTLKGVGVILDDLAPGLAGIATGLGQFFDAIGANLPAVFTALSPLLADIGTFLGTVGTQLGPLLATFASQTLQLLVQVLTDLQPLWEQMTPVLLNLATSVFPALVPLVSALLGLLVALLPILPPLVQIFIAFVPVLVALIPELVMIITLFTNIIRFVTPLITLIAQLVGWVLQMVAAWDRFATNNGLIPYIQSLVGFISGLAGVIGKAADGLERLIGLSNKKASLSAIAGKGGSGGPVPKPYASGGLITSPTLATIGEDAPLVPEAVVPMGSPQQARQVAQQTGLLAMLGSAGTGAMAPIVNVYLGMGDLTRFTDYRVETKLGQQAQALAFGTRGG